MWRYKKLADDDKERDPMQDAFFTIENIEEHTQALVRESTQNTLDESTSDKVKIRIYISSESAFLSPSEVKHYFTDAAQHFKSKDSGLENVPDIENEKCRFMVFEDFNTRGLTGDVTQYHGVTNKENRFYYFLRAEGKSGKGDSDRGRWGIGKYVFPRSSRIKSFFALTVREDDGKEYLSGQSVLKTHTIDNDTFSPDGWWGKHEPKVNLPIDDSDDIALFKDTFNVSRKNDEPGLSIVIPYLEEDITIESLISYMIQEYYHPINFNKLEVEIYDDINTCVITSDNLLEKIETHVKDPEKSEKIVNIINMCSNALEQIETKKYFELEKPKIGQTIRITKDQVSETDLELMKEKFHNEELITVRIPIDVHMTDDTVVESYFDVYIKKNSKLGNGIPVFIREGILVPDPAKSVSKASDVLSVVHIYHKDCNIKEGIATLMGNAENPAHTEWQFRSEKMQKYKYPKAYVNFIKRCVYDIVKLTDENTEKDVLTLRDYFPSPLPNPDGKESTNKKQKKKPKSKKTKDDIPVRSISKPVYTIDEIPNGVIIRGIDESINEPQQFAVKFAYLTKDGNPFQQWTHLDFQLGKDIKIFSIGTGMSGEISIDEKKHNRLLFNVNNNDFKVTVTGFDTNRDIAVDVSRKRIENA
ncbi:hypothetical protein [Sulfurovum sp. AR]|uniref:hypothetical protein n=1 Tax=Sulfurovum sp. AR TaxID=1165841 RepID=UPI00025C4CC6|nr:hypothetical protein [Sulfurovum sp. AR]EIF51374.1 hypothetical protein SULAR_03982 [Sulfurovum sp. AR]